MYIKNHIKKQTRINQENRLFVNLGCGPVQPKGWINVDYSNRAKLARYLPPIDLILTKFRLIPPTEFSTKTTVFDVRKPLPFETSSVHAFYAGELLEHLLPEQSLTLMNECLRALIPGGHLRVNVPDNFEFWKRYCKEHEKMLSMERKLWNDTHSKNFLGMFFRDICVKRPFLGSMGHYHKWAYDEISLILLFEKVGFVNVNRMRFHESKIPDIQSVEKRPHLIVEGSKLK